MSIAIQHDTETLIAHDIDDLLLRARGLALVRDLLAERGAYHDLYQSQFSDALSGAFTP